jgi:IMP dehydrogenase
MAYIYEEPSRTFAEYLLIPNETTKVCVPGKVDLSSPLVRFRRGAQSRLRLNIPMTSAIMQSVSDDNLAIALARCGGLAFIFCSQPIERQAEMVRRVKRFKAGFVESTANLRPDQTLRDVVDSIEKTGHSTIPITDDGTAHGRLLGILTGRDFRPHRTDLNTPIREKMTPFSKLVYGKEGISLTEANDIIWDHKINCLPIIDDEQRLRHLVFRKDYDQHRENPLELVDPAKRRLVGAGINSRDYAERVPALLEAGADVLCIDSSDGYNHWQAQTIAHVKSVFGEHVPVGGGNIVEERGFRYLADAGADFIKVGIGPGSICITREQKGIGRGQATAVIEVAKARNAYFEETGVYVPLCSDGGILQDYHIVLALAMGADFVMLGRYFARFEESPGRRLWIRGSIMKEYWGEGSDRARNWQRYDVGGNKALAFEEGVDAYVPFAGHLKDGVEASIGKIRSTMCNCGSLTIEELQRMARLTLVSSTSIREGGVHDVVLKETDIIAES